MTVLRWIFIFSITAFHAIGLARAGQLFKTSSSGVVVTINTTIPNHSYPQASMKITTPGYSVSASSCDSVVDGVCLFSVSDTQSRSITINGSAGSFNATFCLNGRGQLSCQQNTVNLMGDNKLNAVSCSSSGLLCTAGGYYVSSLIPNGFPSSDYGQSLIYTSSDGGNSWSKPITPYSPSSLTQILGMACDANTGLACQAVGYTINTSISQNQAIIYTSTDGEWNNLQPYNLATNNLVPTNTFFSRLNDVHCSANGLNCLAVGWVSVSGSTATNSPYTVYTNNGGQSWSVPAAGQPVVPSGYNQIVTYGVSCDDSIDRGCVITGYAVSNAGRQVPVSYFSSNGGQSWNSAVFPPLSAQNTGKFETVGCRASGRLSSGNALCVGVGQVNNGSQSLAYISFTQDGSSWTNLSTTPPNDATESELFGVSCLGPSNNQCIAVGGYRSIDGLDLPLSYHTTNSGQVSAPITPRVSENTTKSTLFGVFNTSTATAVSVGSETALAGTLPMSYTSINGGDSWSLPVILSSPTTTN